MIASLRRLAVVAALLVASACSSVAPGVDSVSLVDAPVAFSAADAAVDPLFGAPYIDVDEWRDAPVPHRYIHGGFTGTETRFSFYFPPARQYQGRFFQHFTPVPGSETLAASAPAGPYNKIGFAADSGAYFVETNGGGAVDYSQVGGTRSDPTITAWRANAASARFSRVVASAVYGREHRPFGYCYGGSGGGYRTIGAIESTDGVWDGAVPYVIGSTMAIPNMFSVRMHAMRLLDGQFDRIVDAVEAGGSGDPYAGLTEPQAKALTEVTRMGFPMPAWFGHATMGVHGFAALYQGVRVADPGYFTDFWTQPGYLGHDAPESFEGARIRFETTVAAPVTLAEAAREGLLGEGVGHFQRGSVDTAFREGAQEEGAAVVGFRLAATPPEVGFLGGDLVVHSGAAAGASLPLARIAGNVVMMGLADPARWQGIQAGDRVRVDNSHFLAAQTYHRHQVPGPDFPVWDQFRDRQGKPLYPQRPMLLGPLFVQATAGTQLTGEVDEKMIVVASLWDREAMPWQAHWYRQRVANYLGDAVDDRFRLYYTDRALHGDRPHKPLFVDDPSRVVLYGGALQQALRDLAAWVETDTKPPAGTQYRIEDGQVVVPDDAAGRQGLQPVVTLLAEGGKRVEIAAGETVTFSGTISAPPGTGSVIEARWDFSTEGDYPQYSQVEAGQASVVVGTTHRFETPGTYFVSLRGAAQRDGDSRTPYAVLYHLDRVRVVVRQAR